ncbi:MAG: DNA polymerase I [Dehalococcoidia bacterium]
MAPTNKEFGESKDDLLVAFDGHALFYRSFHAMPSMSGPTGEETGAIYGFTAAILKTLREVNPKRATVAFDMSGPTFRHKAFETYKANRPPMPDEMRNQFSRIREVIEILGIPILELQGFEADDVLGHIAKVASSEDLETIIFTGDQDTMQLVSPTVRVMYQRPGGSNMLFDELAVNEKYGLSPKQIPDLKALMGDSSDNIPGVPGIGSVTATALLKQFNSVDGIYANLEAVEPARVRKKLEDSEDLARQCLELTRIVKDLPMNLDFDSLVWQNHIRRDEIKRVFGELNFNTLLQRVPSIESQEPSYPIPDNEPQSIDLEYSTVNDLGDLKVLLNKLDNLDEIAITVPETMGSDIKSIPTGISLAWGAGQASYIPLANPLLAHYSENSSLMAEKLGDYFNKLTKKKTIVLHIARNNINPLGNIGIQTQDAKIWDTSVAAHLVGMNTGNYESLIKEIFNVDPPIEVPSRGKGKNSLVDLPVEDVASYACFLADYNIRLKQTLEKSIKEQGIKELFEGIEMPLAVVMARMEKTGIFMEAKPLELMSKKMTEELSVMQQKIYSDVIKEGSMNDGFTFNLNSSKQVGEVLFEKLNLPIMKRTKKGAYSTDSSILETLSKTPGPRGSIVSMLLEYRELFKLVSTYLDALPRHINNETGRIHTKLNQIATSTGRIASSDPNLQQIPVRTATGKQIREAFKTRADYLLVSADYSQIELRILAHLSQDSGLIEAFQNGEDIHSSTAAAILNKNLMEITEQDRRVAKAINFGIVYGMSGFGLATRLDMERSLADDFISNYFKKYPKVKTYMDSTIDQARRLGYVETLLGRRRYIPEITSSNANIRNASERMAINMPVQGTAGDLIKIAMIKVQSALDQSKIDAEMLLQIHDELLFECNEQDRESLVTMVSEIMPQALPELSVPIGVEVKSGPNWGSLS